MILLVSPLTPFIIGLSNTEISWGERERKRERERVGGFSEVSN